MGSKRGELAWLPRWERCLIMDVVSHPCRSDRDAAILTRLQMPSIPPSVCAAPAPSSSEERARNTDRVVQLEVVLCAHAIGLSRSWWTVAGQTASLCNFYAST